MSPEDDKINELIGEVRAKSRLKMAASVVYHAAYDACWKAKMDMERAVSALEDAEQDLIAALRHQEMPKAE